MLLQPSSSVPDMAARGLSLGAVPVLFVLSTPAVQKTCEKNGLTLEAILRPHASLRGINVPLRTAGDQPYRLQDFRLRVFSVAEVGQPPVEAAEEHLTGVVTKFSDTALSELHGDPYDIQALLAMAKSESSSSWFQQYVNEFMRMLRFSDHETVDHPVACLLVASSEDKDPLACFQELYAEKNLPSLLRTGIMDPNIHKHYVLLHDLHTGPVESTDPKFSLLRGAYGLANCHVLAINSLQIPNLQREDIWSQFMETPIGSNKLNELQKKEEDAKVHLGQYLSDADSLQVAEFMKELVVQRIIPHMEQKVREHNHQVVAIRKGIRNQLKNFWFRKGKDEETPLGGYTYKSTESQIRVLADYSLMLKDYELALSNYRLLASDYRADKAWKHFAGAQEMIGICLFLLDQSRRETEQCMESAYSYYQRGGPISMRYATRTALWLVGIYKAREQFREAAATLMRASLEESNLRAGLLLEQAAYCFLLAEPMMLRKYGFHMVLAGNRYNLSAQRKHAIRAYTYVSGVYEGKGWNYISDHCNFTLGRLSAFLGSYNEAMKFFMRLLACSHQSATMQATFLREFLYVLQSVEAADGQGPLDLGLPEVNVERVHVLFEDHRTWASASSKVLPEQLWRSLEEGLVPPTIAVAVPNWLDAPSHLRSNNEIQTSNTCVAGEDIVVDIEFKNPLNIAIEVTGVRLICEFLENTAENLSQDRKEGEPLFHVEEASCSLPPSERVVMQLKAKPLVEGKFRVVGMEWTINSESRHARGRKDFAIKGIKRRPGKPRAITREHHPPHLQLNFNVLAVMPRLNLQLHGLPSRTLQGEVHRLTLELSNSSPVKLKNIKLKSSHKGMILVGKPGDLDMELPSYLEGSASSDVSAEGKTVPEESELAQLGDVVEFPKNIVLEGGRTLLWPLWLHAREPGTVRFNMVFYYEPEGTNTSMKYRTLRTTHAVQVETSLQVGVHVSPSPSLLGRYIMRVDVTNQHSADSFWLRQVSCAGATWQMAPLSPAPLDLSVSGEKSGGEDSAFMSASVAPPQLLPPGQASSLFFQLQAEPMSATTTGKKNQGEEWGKNIRLGSPGSPGEAVIDVSSGPLRLFHLLERRLQATAFRAANQDRKVLVGNSEETGLRGGPNTSGVDVVLVWESTSGGASSDAQKDEVVTSSTRIGSHHICHNRIVNWSPLQWVMQGPACVHHNFIQHPVCEFSLSLSLQNCSTFVTSVNVKTIDPGQPSLIRDTNNASNSIELAGWFQPKTGTIMTKETSVSVSTGGTVSQGKTDVANEEQQCGTMPSGPFLWSGATSKSIPRLLPGTCATLRLRVAVLSPGVFNFSSLRVSWRLGDPSKVVTKDISSSSPSSAVEPIVSPEKSSTNSEQAVQLRLVETGPDSWLWISPSIPRQGSGLGCPFVTLVLPSGEE